jgi:hypothetical protein
MRRVSLLLALLAVGCGGSGTAPAPPIAATPIAPTPAPAPTTWAVSGQIVSAGARAPIAGATIIFGDAAPVTSDGSGNYTIVTTDSSTKPLAIAAAGYLTRETSLTGGTAQSGLVFDLIGTEPDFPRQEYLDEVRNAWEGPNKHEPSRRWTTNPNVYIRTLWRDTDVPVRPENIEFLIGELQRAIRQWTAGTLQPDRVETGSASRPLTRGWINVEFGRSGNWSRLGEDPGQIQFGTEGTCTSLAIVHEFGHAMGYWHTATEPAIMSGGPRTCTQYNITPGEAMIARAMYSREPGNVEPDKDGPPPPPPIYHIGPLLPGTSGGSGPIIRCDDVLRR